MSVLHDRLRRTHSKYETKLSTLRTDVTTESVGYRTLGEFYKMLKKQNKLCKQKGITLKFDITLPI